jgi:hypothetical protein
MENRPTTALFLALALGICGGPAAPADLDVGSATAPETSADSRDVLCESPYYFGGNSQSYSGTDRLRGNIYTVTALETLTEITIELDFTGSANIYFYVLEAPAIGDLYTVLSETMVPFTSAGQGYYSSGEISVNLVPGTYYAIGVAWGPETVTYVRDPATLPRSWDLGIVEATAQGDPVTPPITGPVSINPYNGAEYSMTLCFGPLFGELFADGFESGDTSAWSATVP